MFMLHEKIKGEIKQAMLAKDQVKLSVVRGLVAAFTNEVVALKRKPDEKLSDDEALAVIRREAKRRKDAIEQFTAGGRADLVDSEKAELAILETYLPQMMSADEVKKIVETKKAELGVAGKADSGKLMNALMKDLQGKADGSVVKQAVEEILS